MSAEKPSESREIRVFLSSTFRDFMEERDLLVKQVFPELRRKARERGVEVVDVDLRWGITEEESRQGKVIPICLGEIDRCRPYFVGMLGERYGWIPPADQYSPEVIERQPWLKDHLGGASVTELEILHGVLNDPAMAGRAFFYFRDPDWSTSQSEPGVVCETPEEETKLADLKKRIRTSGFPVAENVPDPKALADRIGQDLWELIEQQYPDLDEANALEREERQHASCRRSRLGVYLGGKRSINQLERWIDAGQQKILITGESGAGKSALIANWIEAHQQNHPEDLVFAHHLGCSNDASAIRALLARLIDTAKQQLPEVYGYSLSVPQDWWELVAKAVEALQSLGRWSQQNNHRWIWVLDGLDRLDPDDQNALPWLPLTIPEGVVIMASALECPAREILLERKFKTRTIGPLKAKEQDALIQQYLGRYTKQLIAELRQTILSHPLAGSPLFLRVLLEELRQCGRYETLAEQLSGYLSAETIDDLYERVLERLEADGNGENVRRAMTALWASRAGLSEEELLSITGLKPLQWAPIDLALEEALGRNGNRLVFDHDYLRKAVEDRYLPTEEERRQAHSDLADWFDTKEEWDERTAEELPWQLLHADRKADLRALLLNVSQLFELLKERDSRETIKYWLAVEGLGDGRLDELIAENLGREIDRRRGNTEDLIRLVDLIADLLDEAGLHRERLLDLSSLRLELEIATGKDFAEKILDCQLDLANRHFKCGNYSEALRLLQGILAQQERMLGENHPETLLTVNSLSLVNYYLGCHDEAELLISGCLKACEKVYGNFHPTTLMAINNQATFLYGKGEHNKSCEKLSLCLNRARRFLGEKHLDAITCMNNLACALEKCGELDKAEGYYRQCLQDREQLLGPEHPDTLATVGNLAGLFQGRGDFAQAETFYRRTLEASKRLLGAEHPATLITVGNLAGLFHDKGDYAKAESFYRRDLEASERLLGAEHPDTLITVHNLAWLFHDQGDYGLAESLYRRCLEGRERALGADNANTLSTAYQLANVLSEQKRHAEAISLRRRELTWCRHQNGDVHPSTLSSINILAIELRQSGEFDESEALFRELVAARQEVLQPDDAEIGRALGGLAKTLELAGSLEKALTCRQQALDHRQTNEGPDAWWTNRGRLDLARVLHKLGRNSEATARLQELQESMARINEPDEDDCRLISDAQELLRQVEESAPEKS
jgi:Flp pilus assembly protein TadD